MEWLHDDGQCSHCMIAGFDLIEGLSIYLLYLVQLRRDVFVEKIVEVSLYLYPIDRSANTTCLEQPILPLDSSTDDG